MNPPPPPEMRAFSERLREHEAKEHKSAGKQTADAFTIIEKLRPILTTLLGGIGFSALLSRALAMTHAEVDGWSAVHVEADGSLGGLVELKEQASPKQIAEGTVVLLAQLLGLLVAFIGEHLTLQLVSDVWPKLSLNDLDLGARDTDETAK